MYPISIVLISFFSSHISSNATLSTMLKLTSTIYNRMAALMCSPHLHLKHLQLVILLLLHQNSACISVSLYLVFPMKQEHTSSSTPEAIKPLLQEFADVFETPHRFPLARPISHTIDLIQYVMLSNAPTYRLAPQEATRIEK